MKELFGERVEKEPPKVSCLTCRYFRFVKIETTCSHPGHNRKIKKPRKKCGEWIDRFAKGDFVPKVPYDS